MGKDDYIGVFVVIVGVGIEKWIKVFEVQYDDYQFILFKVLVDCLVEVLVEYMYEVIRKDLWGYVVVEKWENDELIVEKY